MGGRLRARSQDATLTWTEAAAPLRCRLMRRRSTVLAVSVCLALVAAACGDDDAGVTAGTSQAAGGTSAPDGTDAPDDTTPDGTDAPNSTAAPGEDPFGWEDCGDGLECGTLEVPLDYDDPSAGSIELYAVRHPAQDPDARIGSLLVNPGGPGFGGTYLAENAELIYSDAILDHFDIVGWDPRGTGSSSPAVDCVDQYDPYFGLDASPDTADEERALVDAAQEFDDACLENSGDILPHISTEDSARDMDTIRQALGEDEISYFGFSYGSELGATWVTMFPETVRAAVLDGAVDPAAGYIEGGLQQAAGFEQQLSAFLADCSGDPDCEFHNFGDAEAAFDELMASLDTNPLVVDPDRTPVTQGVAYTAVAQAMYSQFLWPSLESALADAQNGDGSGLLDLYDEYFQRRGDGTYGNELEAFLAISCLDDPGPKTVEGVNDYVDDFREVAPRLGDSFAYGYFCALWPIDAATPVEVTGAGAGPIVVIGTTGDAATPLSSTKAMADALEDGRLVIVTADQHTGYGVNRCVVDIVDEYLIDLIPPEDGTRCD